MVYRNDTYIYRLEDCRLQCTDPNKMYEFKRYFIKCFERTHGDLVSQ